MVGCGTGSGFPVGRIVGAAFAVLFALVVALAPLSGAAVRMERTPFIVAADRLAEALGTTLTEMLAELERETNDSSGG